MTQPAENEAPTHKYDRDPQSGAGNCVCGASERHRRHPHVWMPALTDPRLCVCALPLVARCHVPSDSDWENWLGGVIPPG